MVRLSECSSYQEFELSSDFNERVLVKVQGECKNSSSYWKFELSGLYCISDGSQVISCQCLIFDKISLCELPPSIDYLYENIWKITYKRDKYKRTVSKINFTEGCTESTILQIIGFFGTKKVYSGRRNQSIASLLT